MSQYFPPYRSSGRNIKVELDLSNYATKTDLKNVTLMMICRVITSHRCAAGPTDSPVEKLGGHST